MAVTCVQGQLAVISWAVPQRGRVLGGSLLLLAQSNKTGFRHVCGAEGWGEPTSPGVPVGPRIYATMSPQLLALRAGMADCCRRELHAPSCQDCSMQSILHCFIPSSLTWLRPRSFPPLSRGLLHSPAAVTVSSRQPTFSRAPKASSKAMLMLTV